MTTTVVDVTHLESEIQDVIDGARHSLNDDDKLHWPDDELLVYVNEFIAVSRVRHSSWFFGLYTNLPHNLGLGDDWPLDEMFVPACRYFIIARAHGKDMEEAFNEAVKQYMPLSNAVS